MEVRKISDLFWSFSPNLFFLSIVLSICTGLCFSLCIPFVIYATSLTGGYHEQLLIENYSFFQSPTSAIATTFVITFLSVIFIKSISSVLQMYIAQKATVQYRMSLYKRINLLPYAHLESIGHAKLINLLNIDIPTLMAAASSLPTIWISLVTIIGTLGYLAYLSAKVFIFVIISLGITVITFQIPILFGNLYISKSRVHYDRVQQGVTGLIFGAKELKLSRLKSAEYISQELNESERLTLQYQIKGQSFYAFSESYGQIIAFLVIGVVIFHLSYIYQIAQLELFGIVMALVYLTGPIGLLLGTLNGYQKGKIALQQITGFYDVLVEEHVSSNEIDFSHWDSFRLKNVSYQYPNRVDEFALRNISMEFQKGQITFITGGNGSGKSTVSKLISLHYSCTEGKIYLGDNLISHENIASARELVSVIYSDFFVFPMLYGNADIKLINYYLEKLELQDKVIIDNQRFNTVSLSSGQRKRLALLSLLLDDRPICLFDEWASDQDPRFKAIFYREILPELKSRGKVVIVISHDDSYFDCADQLLFMEQGAVREITRK